MKLFQVGTIIVCAVFVWHANIGFGQAPETAENDAVRLTVSISADGSRTVYKFDDAQHKAVATITDQDGKLRQTIRYELDDAARFTSGQIFGPDAAFGSRAGTITTALAVCRKKPKAQKTAAFCIRSFTATIKTANEQAIPFSMRPANCWAGRLR